MGQVSRASSATCRNTEAVGGHVPVLRRSYTVTTTAHQFSNNHRRSHHAPITDSTDAIPCNAKYSTPDSFQHDRASPPLTRGIGRFAPRLTWRLAKLLLFDVLPVDLANAQVGDLHEVGQWTEVPER